MKTNLLQLREGRAVPLWTTKENKTYEANLCLYNQLFALFHYVFKFLTP